MLEAIRHGKHVVTANKALLATHGNEIFKAAQKKGVMVGLRGLGRAAASRSSRRCARASPPTASSGSPASSTAPPTSSCRRCATRACRSRTALNDAQKRGYAEADPTFDIEGVDAAHKLTILSALAFGIPMQFRKAYIEGISKLTREDIGYAEQLGYRIKLLGITKKTRQGHRAARAPDAGADAAPDRQRRGRDERHPGEGRRRRRRRCTTAPAPAASRPRARWWRTWST